jgi:hypothetical protein
MPQGMNLAKEKSIDLPHSICILSTIYLHKKRSALPNHQRRRCFKAEKSSPLKAKNNAVILKRFSIMITRYEFCSFNTPPHRLFN